MKKTLLKIVSICLAFSPFSAMGLGLSVPSSSVEDIKTNGDASFLCVTPDGESINVVFDHGGYAVEEYTWKVYGGIEAISESADGIIVKSLNGTTFGEKYSRYAKGKIFLHAKLIRTEEQDFECCGETVTLPIVVERIERDFEYEIRKYFSRPDNAVGGLDNEIVGPECVVPGKEITYSVTPWVSLKDPDKSRF